ncbi:MAG: uncharacterized protein JWP97_5864 [Labilithrix sp.]|nr:uncharacterized protein [Labilithrix sp.]
MLALLAPALTAGCLWLRDVDGLSAGAEASDGGPRAEGAATDDASRDADGGLPDLDGASCPGHGGPLGIQTGAYCIDRTEVRVGDYRAFLASRAGDTSGQPPVCAWNTDFRPTNGGIPGASADDRPIVNVDYCDALAFCASAGKRLCGAVAGGTGRVDDYANAARSQWYRACSHNEDGLHGWPYGNDYDPQACNGADKDAGVTLPVGSLPGCRGGYAGVLDLSGNVREWEDACELAGTPDASTCLVRGGAFYDNSGTLSCANLQVMAMTATNPGVGFRCCGP